jgi:hypothetical protein
MFKKQIILLIVLLIGSSHSIIYSMSLDDEIQLKLEQAFNKEIQQKIEPFLEKVFQDNDIADFAFFMIAYQNKRQFNPEEKFNLYCHAKTYAVTKKRSLLQFYLEHPEIPEENYKIGTFNETTEEVLDLIVQN